MKVVFLGVLIIVGIHMNIVYNIPELGMVIFTLLLGMCGVITESSKYMKAISKISYDDYNTTNV